MADPNPTPKRFSFPPALAIGLAVLVVTFATAVVVLTFVSVIGPILAVAVAGLLLGIIWRLTARTRS
jgi:high-affinity Fe2+/Pb2+ permease